MNLIDTHCHLAHGKLYQNIPALLEEAAAANVSTIICAAADLHESKTALGLAQKYPNIYSLAGVHPHEAQAADAEMIRQIGSIASHDRCVAIGEIGLDYHYDFSPREDQRRVFAEQLELARTMGAAVVIHAREAFDETMVILADSGIDERRVLFHSFTGSPAEAKRCLDIGAMLSFSGIATFNSAADIRSAAVLCPPDRILVETDAPYLSPEPVRKIKTNVPANVVHVAMRLAAERNTPVETFAKQTTENARKFFNLDNDTRRA
ncbi:MAG: TatD family hydrolase [Phycisphaerae bacterium]|nr:TatD family hydrolase [Phycisphaerae bacterium]